MGFGEEPVRERQLDFDCMLFKMGNIVFADEGAAVHQSFYKLPVHGELSRRDEKFPAFGQENSPLELPV